MQTKNVLKVTALLITLSWLVSCQKEDKISRDFKDPKMSMETGFEENDMVLLWNENMARVLGKTASPPPILSRHATMAQIAVHDALNSIKPKYQTYALKDARSKNADPGAAIASAAYYTFKNLDAYLKTFPPNTVGLPLQASGNDWDGWYSASIAAIPDGSSKEDGIALGKASADAIMAKRADDNYALARIVYQPVPPFTPEAGIWRPTISQAPVPASHSGGLPNWTMQMKSFAGMQNNEFRPGQAPVLSGNDYLVAFNEIKDLGARTASTRTEEQTLIANFWQEGPVQIWNRFTRTAILDKKMDAWKSARLLALVNTAIFDGLLTSFDGLYYYKYWRPESAIRNADADGNLSTAAIPDWLPFVTDIKVGPAPQTPTPPIPEYPNTNATLGSAATELMTLFFETDRTNVDLVTQDVTTLGTSRQFHSFSAAGREYGLSRIYAGFSFRFSIDAGATLGQQVGQYVFNNFLREN
jgi:hypothetical protein